MFSGKILTEKSATETVGTGTQEGRHNDHFGLISDIYRNHEMIVSIQCVSFCLYFSLRDSTQFHVREFCFPFRSVKEMSPGNQGKIQN